MRHCRWFPASDVTATEAKFLDVILYSAEQLAKEYLAMPGADREGRKEPPAPWGIISVKAQVRGQGHGSSAQGFQPAT